MLSRLKRGLIESFVGAIGLGYVLAQTILHFMSIFTAPIVGWIARLQYRNLTPSESGLPGFSMRDSVPEVARFVVLLLVWYVLFRWLYLKPVTNGKPGTKASAEPA